MRQRTSRQFWQSMLWVALCVAICNAVVPAALRIALVAQGDRLVEVCSSFGIKRLLTSRTDSGSVPESADKPACKICLASNAACVTATAQLLAAAHAPHAAYLTLARDDARLAHDGWRSGRPRAPPALA